MLFTVRGSTSLPLTGMSFATDGVDNFVRDTLKTDPQDLLAKMEGFAIQGVKGTLVYIRIPDLNSLIFIVGAARNHQQRVSGVRANIRNEVTEGLSKLYCFFLFLYLVIFGYRANYG